MTRSIRRSNTTLKLFFLCLITTILVSFSINHGFADAAKGDLSIHVVDVGQADAIILKTDKGAVLIDAGNNGDWTVLDKYIKSLNIKKFDLLVATHSHEDHIGSMANIIKNYSASKLLMPKEENTTKTFKNMMGAAKDKKLPIEYAKAGNEFTTAGVKFKVLAPLGRDYSDRNNYSVVLMATYGTKTFLFTGDAETDSEHEMVKKWGKSLKADLLKVGHHGSGTSSTAQFLKLVSPSIAAISVGTDNEYNHPDPLIIKRLPLYGVKTTLRTDKNGTIILTTDGKTITQAVSQ